MTPEERAVRVVMTFQDEPPGSPRRSPPLAAMIAQEIREAVREGRVEALEDVAFLCEFETAKTFESAGGDAEAHGARACAEMIRALAAKERAL